MNKYNVFLNEIFCDDKVFKTGNELNNMLQERFGINTSNARKVVSRACSAGVIASSKPVTFGNGQYVYFRNNSSLNTNVIKEITRKNRPPVYHLLTLLESNDGIISYYEGLKITASPLKKEKEKSNTLNEIIEMLESLKIVEIAKDKGIIYIILSNRKDHAINLMKKHRNNMIIDCMLIPDINNWLVKHNIIDNRNVVYRNKNLLSKGAEHNNNVWDAYAYTNTTGYNTVLESSTERDSKKTLVVLDVVVFRNYTSSDVQGFLRRVQAVRSSAKTERKVLPIVVYKEITAHAYSQIKSLGFIMLNLGSIYGTNIYPIIQSVSNIRESMLHEFTGDIVDNVNFAMSTIESSGQNENLGNMKGDLFEALMYPAIKRMHPDSSIEQGRVLKRKNPDGTIRNYEYDIIVRDYNAREIIVYEFKGRNSDIEIPLKPFDKPNTVKWFFGTTLVFAREELQKGVQNPLPVKGCYITTAKFSEESLEFLNKINTHQKQKPNSFDVYYDGGKLIELLTNNKLDHIISVLKKYFIKQDYNREKELNDEDVFGYEAPITKLESIDDLDEYLF
ncbi:hypothetical protein [Bacillus salipaludis]|uniref:Uncharacterized protein n=1 Tax=Bacillus salipaludis TaxID=2547811 RepID=A0ABW8RF43_9BACI